MLPKAKNVAMIEIAERNISQLRTYSIANALRLLADAHQIACQYDYTDAGIEWLNDIRYCTEHIFAPWPSKVTPVGYRPDGNASDYVTHFVENMASDETLTVCDEENEREAS